MNIILTVGNEREAAIISWWIDQKSKKIKNKIRSGKKRDSKPINQVRDVISY